MAARLPFISRAFSTSKGAMTADASLSKVPASSLYVSRPVWWLESRFHFSFAEYWDKSRSSFGPLRVLNDDLVQPRAGFGRHRHSDAEIFSYVIEGELSHADSMGNSEALPRGGVQYMSAGTGVIHSELNEGHEVCRFLQVWIAPDKRGHTPQYGSVRYTPEQRHNRLLHALGGTGRVPAWGGLEPGAGIQLHQDANVFISENDGGVAHGIELGAGRQAYLVCIEGSASVAAPAARADPVQLGARDAATLVAGSAALPCSITAGEDGAHFMLIEMQAE